MHDLRGGLRHAEHGRGRRRRHTDADWIGSAVVLATTGSVWAGLGRQPVDLAQRGLFGADRLVAGLEATSARDTRHVASFTTIKTFTIEHDGETRAQIVAALRFTAPDVKAFAVTANRGSEFLRGRVIDRMMAAEIETTQRSRSASVAISAANYEFAGVREDGDAFVLEVLPRRQDELLFKGRIWVTREGFISPESKGSPPGTRRSGRGAFASSRSMRP